MFLFNKIHGLDFNHIPDRLFRGCSRMGVGAKRLPLPKICHTYPTMMKLCTVMPYLKKIQKLYHVTHPMSPANISSFLLEISKFGCIKKHIYRLHFDTKSLILLTFLESLKIVLTKKVIILMMSAKMATPGLLKITGFRNKGYDVIIYVHDVTNKILSRDSNNVVNAVI